ncbi:hypothetical protein MJO29_011071 [Puccinia striiformis f. sp. tritici]|nr:hypothetical protein MJO29_011071 [Puccinia striiformis f. sp. tritici]
MQSKFNHPIDNRPSFIGNISRMTSPSSRKEIDPEINWNTPLVPNKQSPSSNAPNIGNENDEINLRAEHMKMAQEGMKTGRIGLIIKPNAGAISDSDASVSKNYNPDMIGNIIEFPTCLNSSGPQLSHPISIEEAQKLYSNDIYSKQSAWDVGKLQITPVKTILVSSVGCLLLFTFR